MIEDALRRNRLKSQYQEKILNYSKTYPFLLLQLATGVGKTRASLLVLNDNPGKWLILVKEISHIDTWKSEFKKHGFEKDLENVLIVCYASMHKYTNFKYTGIILDEVHACCGAARLATLRLFSTERVLGLSATLKRDYVEGLKSVFPFKRIKYDLARAIREGLLPVPKIVILQIPMSETSTQKYESLNHNIAYFKERFMEGGDPWDKIKWMAAGSERKRFIAKTKTLALSNFVEGIQERFICFCGSIEQATILDKSQKHTVHSNIKNNRKVIADFQTKTIDKIFTVKMLQEAANLVDCNLGVIGQLDGQTLSAVQRLGRLLRGTSPQVYVACLKDTQDETYLTNLTEVVDEKYIEYLTL